MQKWTAICLIGIALTFAGCHCFQYRENEKTDREYIKNGYVYKQVGNHWYSDYEWQKGKD